MIRDYWILGHMFLLLWEFLDFLARLGELTLCLYWGLYLINSKNVINQVSPDDWCMPTILVDLDFHRSLGHCNLTCFWEKWISLKIHEMLIIIAEFNFFLGNHLSNLQESTPCHESMVPCWPFQLEKQRTVPLHTLLLEHVRIIYKFNINDFQNLY